jgi:hypothetical protein
MRSCFGGVPLFFCIIFIDGKPLVVFFQPVTLSFTSHVDFGFSSDSDIAVGIDV